LFFTKNVLISFKEAAKYFFVKKTVLAAYLISMLKFYHVLKETQKKIPEKKSLIRRFGFRENMSRTYYW